MPIIFGFMDRELFFTLLDAVIQSPKRIAVLTHVNPDGDAIGSSLGMAQFLLKLGHEVEVIVPNAFPGFLSWMPGASQIHVYDNAKDECDQILDGTDCIFILDYNHISRSGLMQNKLKALETTKILIDHHRDADFDKFFSALSDTEVSSTAELVAETVLHYGESFLDESIATNILVGIITDTGSFSYSLFRPETFSICAKLFGKAPSYNTIHRMIYDTFSEDRLRLLGYSISNKMEVLDEYSTSIISLSKEELSSFNYQVGDTEGVVNYPLSMEKIKMAILVTERQDVIRLSFRSKGSFSVHEFAQRHFNGGGHTNAAGGTLTCSLEEALDKIHRLLPEYKDLLNTKD